MKVCYSHLAVDRLGVAEMRATSVKAQVTSKAAPAVHIINIKERNNC